MSSVSLPVTRPIGRALVVANPSGRDSLVQLLARLGFECGECDDPYTATLELARRRLAYRALILSLASLYREELSLIPTIKRRFPHLEIWLVHTDGRQAALAESMRLGADGLLDEDGPHRIASPAMTPTEPTAQPVAEPLIPPQPQEPEAAAPSTDAPEARPENEDVPISEPVLTAEELRALLQDQTAMPPSGEE